MHAFTFWSIMFHLISCKLNIFLLYFFFMAYKFHIRLTYRLYYFALLHRHLIFLGVYLTLKAYKIIFVGLWLTLKCLNPYFSSLVVQYLFHGSEYMVDPSLMFSMMASNNTFGVWFGTQRRTHLCFWRGKPLQISFVDEEHIAHYYFVL